MPFSDRLLVIQGRDYERCLLFDMPFSDRLLVIQGGDYERGKPTPFSQEVEKCFT